MRAVRISHGLTRWLLYVVVLVGVGTTVRFAIAPPVATVRVVHAAAQADVGGEFVAEQFTRSYLTWTGEPAEHEQALAAFLGGLDDPNAGLLPAAGGTDHAEWVAIAAQRAEGASVTTYTVAAQTDHFGLLYVAVSIERAHGRYVLAEYPSLVGPPPIAPAGSLDGPGLPSVANPALETVLSRGLDNYLDDSTTNLDADLAQGAEVSPPIPSLHLTTVERLGVEPNGTILATVVATDTRGDSFTLSYQVGVALRAARWEITAVEPVSAA
jgi:hypothetical protein